MKWVLGKVDVMHIIQGLLGLLFYGHVIDDKGEVQREVRDVPGVTSLLSMVGVSVGIPKWIHFPLSL